MRRFFIAFLVICQSPLWAAVTLEEATVKVQSFLKKTEPARVVHYCQEGTDACRVLYQRKDRLTGELSPSFYDQFYSFERGVQGFCFILFNEKTQKYEVYSDLVADGKIEINQILEGNKDVFVTFDEDNYPTTNNIVLTKLGSTTGLKGVMSFSATGSLVEGKWINLEDGSDLDGGARIEYLPIPAR